MTGGAAAAGRRPARFAFVTRRIGLSVSSRQLPAARRLYGRVGMREIAGWQLYEKRVEG